MALGISVRRPAAPPHAKALAPVWLAALLLAMHPQAHAAEHQLFLTATNDDGTSVDDLRADEIIVQNAGLDCNVTLAQRTPALKVALLVDNSDSAHDSLNSLRNGLRNFLEALPAQHELALLTIGGQARLLEDFTTDREALLERAGGIFVERASGVLFLDGLLETWDRRFSDDDPWPMFVSVLYDGTEASHSVQEKELAEFANALRQRSATVHVVIVSRRGGALQTNVSLFLTKETGGSYEAINAATALPDILANLATAIGTHFDQVKERYRIVFDCGDTVPEQIQAGITRPEVNVSLFADRRAQP